MTDEVGAGVSQVEVAGLIERLERLATKATQAPWRKFRSRYGRATIAIMEGDEPAYDDRGHHVSRWPEIIAWTGFDGAYIPKSKRHANARLIVALVNGLPTLIAHIKALEAERDRLREAVNVDSQIRPSDDDLDPHLPEYIEAAKCCGIQRSEWLTGWFVPWSPRNDNQNAEGPWSDWVLLAREILAADEKAHAALSTAPSIPGGEG